MSGRRSILRILLLLALVATLIPYGEIGGPEPAAATPVATTAAQYQQYGRVFPDPQGCHQGEPGASPYAEGNVCATDFIQFGEMQDGLAFLSSIDPAQFSGMYPEGGRTFEEFIEIERLDEDYADVLNLEAGEGMSAGLPQNDLSRQKFPLFMVKVTDEKSDIPEAEREHFGFSLSIHGIERAGAEGGIRAVEDLVTWGATDPKRPLLITDPTRSVSVAEALRRSVVYFLMPNPDGWMRGNTQTGGIFYQRYNGNGVDLNRDWPAEGFTFRPYTPLSEPESRSFAKVLQHIKGETADDRFRGFNDLHGQLIDRAFSFTLIGGALRPFDKNEESVRVMQQIWADQEMRLSWSPIIKPNDAPPACVEPSTGGGTNEPPDCDPTPRVYADQWGTIWDTIAYTVTGALGDWADSPLGLNALGLDNEMSLSHLSNCGTGKCFDQQAEQIHVDGNKGLIYAQMNLQLNPQDHVFRQPGRTLYLDNPYRVTHPGTPQSQAPEYTDLPPQEDESATITQPPNTPYVFEVQGPDDGVYNGGFTVRTTFQNVQGVSPGAVTTVTVERRRTEEEQPSDSDAEGEWTRVNSDYNQAPTYLQGGMVVNVNQPLPGTYRVVLGSPPPGVHQIDIDYTTAQSWPDPGQLPYDVSNVDFFEMMNGTAREGYGFTPATVQQILDGAIDLSSYDNLVLADDFMPGWRPPLEARSGPAQEPISASTATGAPGAGVRTPATSTFVEFDVVDANNGEMRIEAVPTAPADLDLYLQVQLDDGSYSGDIAQGASGSLSNEVLVLPDPDPGHYRLEVHNWAGPAGNPVSIDITFEPAPPIDEADLEPIVFTDAQRDGFLRRLAAWAEAGGNLVLTDAALEALQYLPEADGSGPLFPPDEQGDPRVEELKVYAGHVEFQDENAEGEYEETYAKYDLAKEVNRPGAAEGPNHRHQTAEPVPTGYAIQNESGSDLNSHPNWVVDEAAWEEAGGITVGTSQSDSGVAFGELSYGNGTIRILGSLLPMPTEEFDHPFGLSPYGLTWSGYVAFENLLDHVRPGGHWRIAGRNRFETSVEVALKHWNTMDAVVIANGRSFADALSAVPLAKALDAPILLSEKDGLPLPVFQYLLARNPQPTRAYLVGGDAVLSQQVADDLNRVYIDEVVRVAGADRFETSVAVARQLEAVTGQAPTKAVVATGAKTRGLDAWPDALAAGPVAANLGPDRQPVPLLLVDWKFLPEVTKRYLEEKGIEQTLVAGGPEAVADRVLSGLPKPRRVAGPTRIETAVRLAEELAKVTGEAITEATVATAVNFPDALVVGSPGGRDIVPTLLTWPYGVPDATRSWLEAHARELRQVYVAGGPAVVPEPIAQKLEAITQR